MYPFLFIFSTYPCIWINCIRHISFVSSGECLNQALPLLPFPGGRDTSPDTARCSRFTVFIEELHLESCVIFIFQTTICWIKKFSRPGGDSCHYLRFEFSLKSWIDDFTISKRGHSSGFLLSFTIEAQKSEVLQNRNRILCKKHFSCFRVCVGSAAWPPAVKGSVSGVGFAWQVSPKGDSWLSFTTFLTNSATPFIWTPSGGAGASLKERRRPKGKT